MKSERSNTDIAERAGILLEKQIEKLRFQFESIGDRCENVLDMDQEISQNTFQPECEESTTMEK